MSCSGRAPSSVSPTRHWSSRGKRRREEIFHGAVMPGINITGQDVGSCVPGIFGIRSKIAAGSLEDTGIILSRDGSNRPTPEAFACHGAKYCAAAKAKGGSGMHQARSPKLVRTIAGSGKSHAWVRPLTRARESIAKSDVCHSRGVILEGGTARWVHHMR